MSIREFCDRYGPGRTKTYEELRSGRLRGRKIGKRTIINVIAPGPGHSRADCSLSIKIDPTAPDGFVVHSFAGDPPIECRDHVRAALSLGAREQPRRKSSPPCIVSPDDDAAHRSALALRLWSEARDPGGRVVAGYLASRGLTLPDDIAGDVIRFHPALKFDGLPVAAMVALYRDIRTNEPCGIHRTFLDGAGNKLDRKMLGRARDAAIKLNADESVTLGLNIGEGVETCLAARLAGFRPVWALGSATAIAAFPLLSGIEAISQRRQAWQAPVPQNRKSYRRQARQARYLKQGSP